MTELEKTLKEQNEFLQKTVESLNANIEVLTEEIKELEERLNKKSHNSSKPPSSDGYSKPNPKSLRPKSNKKPGGQKGHKFSNLPVPKKINRIVPHYPEKCTKCPLFEKCKGTVVNKVEKCASLIAPLMTKIKGKLTVSSVVHFDETGIRVDGKTK